MDRYESKIKISFGTDQYGRYLGIIVPEDTEPYEAYKSLSGSGVVVPDLKDPTAVSILERTLKLELSNAIVLQLVPGDDARQFLERARNMPAKEKAGREIAWQEISDLLEAGKFKARYLASADQRVPEFNLPGSFYR